MIVDDLLTRDRALRSAGKVGAGFNTAIREELLAALDSRVEFVGRLYRAFHDARTRRRWLPDVKLAVRTATRDKTMRVTWPDGTSVEIYFVSKGAAKSQLAAHTTYTVTVKGQLAAETAAASAARTRSAAASRASGRPGRLPASAPAGRAGPKACAARR